MRYKIWLKSRDVTEVHSSVPISFPLRRCTMRDLRRGRETVRATINGGKVPLTAEKKKKRNPFGATRREKEGRKFVCRQFFFFSLGGGALMAICCIHIANKKV